VWLSASAWLCLAALAAQAQTTSAPAANASAGGAARAGLNRWAILAAPVVQTSGLPDLLTAALTGDPGLTLVERNQIAAPLKELTPLAARLRPERASERQFFERGGDLVALDQR